MKTTKIILAAFTLFFFSSCSKEYSQENGGALGPVCKLSNITALDEISGIGVYALNTEYDNIGKANYIELYDSALNNIDFQATLDWVATDTIKASNNDVLVIDASKRLKKLITPLDPNDPAGEKLIYEYKYNGAGYLVEKTLSTSTIPLALFQTIYTWNGGNLVKIESSSSLTGTKEKLADITLEYDISKTLKGFVPIYPDAFESFIYLTSVDLGKATTNLLKRVSVIYYDDQGNAGPALVTEISEAKFSNEGYLTEWYVNGYGFDALGIFNGRTSFSYSCN